MPPRRPLIPPCQTFPVDVSNLYGHTRHQGFVLGQSRKRALLLHGFPGTPAEVLPLAEFLLSKGYEVHGPLHPGLGMGIETLGKMRWQAWVEAAKTNWAKLQDGAEASILIGFSMGGAVALNVAHAVKPEQLVMIAPFWRLNHPLGRIVPLAQHVVPQLKPFKNADFTTSVIRDQFIRLEPTLDLNDPVVQRELRDRVVLPTSALAELQRLGQHAYRVAPHVTTPTLVVQGRQDTTVAPTDTRRLALRLGGPVTLVELDGADHQLIEPSSQGYKELLARLEAELP